MFIAKIPKEEHLQQLIDLVGAKKRPRLIYQTSPLTKKENGDPNPDYQQRQPANSFSPQSVFERIARKNRMPLIKAICTKGNYLC